MTKVFVCLFVCAPMLCFKIGYIEKKLYWYFKATYQLLFRFSKNNPLFSPFFHYEFSVQIKERNEEKSFASEIRIKEAYFSMWDIP